jgi:hypothetical protein
MTLKPAEYSRKSRTVWNLDDGSVKSQTHPGEAKEPEFPPQKPAYLAKRNFL